MELLKQAKGNTLLSNTCIGVLWFYAGQRVNSVPVDQKLSHTLCLSVYLSINLLKSSGVKFVRGTTAIVNSMSPFFKGLNLGVKTFEIDVHVFLLKKTFFLLLNIELMMSVSLMIILFRLRRIIVHYPVIKCKGYVCSMSHFYVF